VAGLATFIFGTAAILMQSYMERNRQADLANTLVDIEDDLGFPRPQYYDFIIGPLIFVYRSRSYHLFRNIYFKQLEEVPQDVLWLGF